ncbi:hypothetical protein ADU78_07395 [Clostridium botulinum]|uniref:winged helix-turn-helix domain-containing protein n=1 Tax=Clostridium botulinum TaxID=1491 RepID=UPI0004D45940|nr:winged helix-turn-helix domain-containing protein [Clostridium botulinum]KEI04292.1 hypothetical protein Z953_02985 [Clostridium botulinum D str. 16868]KOA75676.1 hypothetical protein ADU78_07395 [Clostridium botulinum]
MDKLDTIQKQKKFFKVVYGDLVGEGNSLKENNYIRLYQAKDDFSKVEFFNNIDDLVGYTCNKGYDINTYFNLATTNGQSGQEKDLLYRTVLGFDFDKKDLGEDFSYKDIMERFKSIGLWYHVLIDSGHGFHAYVCIEHNTDLHKVMEVQKVVGKLLGADLNALKSTQVLRVPYTYNIKDKPKRVNIIKMFDKNTIKRYNIDKLYNRFCNSVKDVGNKGTQYILNNTNIPPCIQDILNNGSTQGERYEDLQKIVVSLRDRNKTLSDIKQVCKEWAYKSNYKDSLDNRIDNIYNNRKYISMDCKGCKHSKECWNKIESNFNYSDGEVLLNMSETHTSKLKASNRKGGKVMESNDLLIYCILKNHADGLYRDEIVNELTYKDKCRLSKNTLTKALQSLEDNGFIEVSGKPKLYKLKDIRSKIELTYNISYGATYECVKGAISTDELRLYNYMRYLHNKQQREEPKGLKGNLFQFKQIDLAKDLGVTQPRISDMINNLLEEKIISIWYRQPSKFNGFDFYIYRLNY